ncbi:AMP-binding protein [Ectothiorhodospiraceae bacterium 2226]|nr:AMP-binding protein [Ectothiorhodospiraceae bacterium 2226]
MDDPSLDTIALDEAGTLDGLLRARLRRTPEAVAYRSYDKAQGTWQDTRWLDVGRAVERWAAALAAEGLQPGQRVALALRNCTEWVCFDQAAMRLGLVVVPLYPNDRPENVDYILRDAAARVLLVQDLPQWRRLAPALHEHPSLARVLLLNTAADSELPDPRLRSVASWLPEQATAPEAHAGDPHALATIVYTSGTTGRPKGVMLSHHNILSVTRASLQRFHCYTSDLFLSFLPLSHTLERTAGYYLPMMAGSTVAYARSVPQLAEDIKQLGPTVLVAVPRIFERVYLRIRERAAREGRLTRAALDIAVRAGWRRFLVEQGRARRDPSLMIWKFAGHKVAAPVKEALGGRLRVAVSGGAPLPLPVSQFFLGLDIPLLQGYGLTETSPVISVNALEDNDPASVGRPLDGIEVRIGANQELLVRGPGVMMGYWNNHSATAEMIDAEGWLHTGDQACLADGRIYITGRIKEILVLSNGEKVPAAEAEAALSMDSLIERAVVLGEGHAYLAAIVELNPEAWEQQAAAWGLDSADPASLDDKRLHDELLKRARTALSGFPRWARVRRVAVSPEPWTVDNGLITPTLKVRRAQIEARYRERIAPLFDGRE